MLGDFAEKQETFQNIAFFAFISKKKVNFSFI